MKAKGPILLLITAILWGFAFVAQTTASSDIGPFTFNASRNIIGAVFLTGVIATRKRLGHDEAPQQGSEGNASGYTRKALVIAGVACGVVLFFASYLQQAGITAYPDGAAASSRSGFVTATYMIMVALMGVIVGKKTQPIVFVAVAVSMLGMYLLCVPDGLGSIYLGDWLVLASAFGYALHIIVIDHFTSVDGVRLSRIQLMTSAAIALVCALAFEHPDPAAIAAAFVAILYAGICSDGIAYTFQIIAQKTTDTTVASILMSLESVFAAIGGWLILSESLSAVELLGCALVFAAVMLAQVPQFVENSLRKRAGRAS